MGINNKLDGQNFNYFFRSYLHLFVWYLLKI